MAERKWKWGALALAIVLAITSMPMKLYAAEVNLSAASKTSGDAQEEDSLCEHHPKHTGECGYLAGEEGSPCTHEHTDECYTDVTKCVLEQESEEDKAEVSDADDGGDGANHVCSVESGCITKTLSCSHAEGDHDASCGYTEGKKGEPCTFECPVCNHTYDTGVVIHIPETTEISEADGTIDLLKDVTAQDGDGTAWPVSVYSVIDSENNEPVALEEDHILYAKDGMSYMVVYVACREGEDGQEFMAAAERVVAFEEAVQTLDVNGDEAAAAMIDGSFYATLQEAVNAIGSEGVGTTITLLRDVKESVNSAGKTYTLDMANHKITGNGDSVYTITGGKVTLQNGTITGGNAQGFASKGGGIRAEECELTLQSCEISGNSAYNGGGIYAKNTEITIEENTVISGNSANRYGALYINNVDTDKGFKVEDTQIRSNQEEGEWNVYIYCADGSMKSTQISENENGGLCLKTKKDKTMSVSFEDVAITGNKGNKSALDCCGGNNNAYSTPLIINLSVKDCEITGNQVEDDNPVVWLDGYGTKELINCTISDNTNEKNSTILVSRQGEVSLTDSTIRNNKASIAGAIDYAAQGYSATAVMTVKNTVITGNTATGTKTDAAGGIRIQTGLNSKSMFKMESGALYGNTSENTNANDLYVNVFAEVSILAANAMKDQNQGNDYFNNYGYKWYESGTGTGLEQEIGKANAARYFTARPSLIRYEAKIGDKKYEKFAQAVEEAADGQTIQLIIGEEDDLGKVISSPKVALNKSVILDMNDRTLKTEGNPYAEVFEIQDNGALTIQGKGTIDGRLRLDGEGKLYLKGDVETGYILHNGALVEADCPVETLSVTLYDEKFVTVGENFDANVINIGFLNSLLETINSAEPMEDMVLLKGCEGLDMEALAKKIKLPADVNSVFVSVEVSGNDIVLHKKAIDGVFLDGTNGSDSNSGLTVGEPVKTFAKAKEILEAAEGRNTIYVTGTIAVEGDESWSLPDGAMMKRYPDTQKTDIGNLVQVKDGGKLTLRNITIDGAKGENIKSNGALIEVERTGNLQVEDGTVLQNNGKQGDANRGGAVVNHGTFEMTGGKISGNSANGGGGVYTTGSFSLKGGEISNNTSTGKKIYDAGGGVLLGGRYNALARFKKPEFKMTGGTISGNSANDGGGVALGSEYGLDSAAFRPEFEMTGGTIEGNTSESCGGGIFVQMNCAATVRSGNITGNISKSGMFGGGGIYVNGGRTLPEDEEYKDYELADGILQLYNVEISNNKAADNGGGVAGCPTSTVQIYLTNGGLIYDNNAGQGAKDIYVTSEPMTMFAGTASASISEYMLGGGLYCWKDDEGAQIPVNALQEVSAVNAHTDLKATDEDIQNGKKFVRVFITGNSSNTNGGGIGSNGVVIIGENPEETVNISVEKHWNDKGAEDQRPDFLDIWLWRNGEKISFVRINQRGDWKAGFKKQPKYDPAGAEYVYTVTEDDDRYESTVTAVEEQTNSWKVTVTNIPLYALKLEKKVNGKETDRKFNFTVTLKKADGSPFSGMVKAYDQKGRESEISFENGKAAVQLGNGDSLLLKGLSEKMAYSVEEGDSDADHTEIMVNGKKAEQADGIIQMGTVSLAFQNIYGETGDLAISKTVGGNAGDQNKYWSFELDLRDRNGNALTESYSYRGSQSGVIANGGTISLKHGESVTIDGLPEGTHYCVTEKEANRNGYKTTVTGGSGEIMAGKTAEAVFQNEKEEEKPVQPEKPGEPDKPGKADEPEKSGDSEIPQISAAPVNLNPSSVPATPAETQVGTVGTGDDAPIIAFVVTGIAALVIILAVAAGKAKRKKRY